MTTTSEYIDLSSFDRYIEPLLGCGHSIIYIKPSIPCHLNDPSEHSVNFFKNIKEPELIAELKLIEQNWILLSNFCELTLNELFMVYSDFNSSIISSEDIEFMVRAILMMNMENESYQSLIGNAFSVSYDMLANSWVQEIEKTIVKLKNNEQLKEIFKPNSLFHNNIETAIRKGLFEHFISLVNLQNTGLIDCLDIYKKHAILFLLRNTCKEKELVYSRNGNLKLKYDKANSFLSNFQEYSPLIFEKERSIKIETISNYNPKEFLGRIEATINDVVAINFLDNKSLCYKDEIISSLPKVNSNILILTKDTNLANELSNAINLNITNSSNILILRNF